VAAARFSRFTALALAGISSMILGASAACSWLIAHGWSMQWRVLFRLVCHGIPSRCLLLFGVPMPICARCTAIYLGLIAGAVVFRLVPRMSEMAARAVAIAAALPMALDGGTQLIRLRESTNDLRVVTGLAAGIALALWLLTAARTSSVAQVHQTFESS
jgi:uncharacterized membrane protein